MKRQEIVNKIADVLLQFNANSEYKLRQLIADVVLTECEREGMFPPGLSGSELTVTKMNGELIGVGFEEFGWEK